MKFKHLFITIINVYITVILCLMCFYFAVIKCGIGHSLSTVSIAKLFSNAKLYAKMLDVILLLMKNSGVILCGISLVFLLILSLFSHAFKSNFLSYFSIIVILANYIYIIVRDTTYGFYNTKCIELIGMKIPELDVVIAVALAPLLILYVINVIVRRCL